jgi:hypothetical protein
MTRRENTNNLDQYLGLDIRHTIYGTMIVTKRYHVTAMSVSNFSIVENYLCCILYFKEFTYDLICTNGKRKWKK